MTVRMPLCSKHNVVISFLAALLCLGVALPLSARSKAGQKAKSTQEQAKPKKQTAVKQKGPARMMSGEDPAREEQEANQDPDGVSASSADGADGAPAVQGRPIEGRMQHARSWNGDVRDLPRTKPRRVERPELEGPAPAPTMAAGTVPTVAEGVAINPVAPQSAPAPAPAVSFEGLDFATWGAGHPPDTNGDVGPNHYIETVNTSVGIYSKTGTLITAFTFNTFMSQGHFGNLCDTNNFGDPVVLYDTFEDRWILTDFAFQLSGGNVIAPAFQCFAASKTGDPVAGGWNFYSIKITDALNDYPKFGIWRDGLYMASNMFGFGAGGTFRGTRVWAFDKAQMYAGAPSVQIVSFNPPLGDFTLLPANARLQAGTPPAGTPNYFVSTWLFLNALTVYKFHVDWNHPSLSTFTGPDTPIAATSWPNAAVANAPSQGGNLLDVLQIRAMMQNQYTNIGGAESLWATHTVRRQNTTGFAAPRWYQVDVTGGTVAAALPQAATWDPDGANVINRFMPSLAVNRVGDLALGYSTSSSTTKPAIKYAGRLASDPVNTFSQTEQVLIQGAGTQVGNCGSSACIRWGDYSAMTLDPDGCTFWFTTEYYQVDGLNDNTRIGAFSYPSCTPLLNNGILQGTVTASSGGAPIAGATVALGARTATTDSSGFYVFTDLPAGTYPTLTANAPGFSSASATGVVVSDSSTTTQDFALGDAPRNACLVDTTLDDFLVGVQTNCDLTTSPGDILLAPTLDQLNQSVSNSGNGINTTNWSGQTFLAGLSGQLARAEVSFFCSGCTGTAPDLTLSVRATDLGTGLPTGPDLATATIRGNASGSASFGTATFAAPATITAGTTYALILRPIANPSAGIYAPLRSAANAYASGARVTSPDSGVTWTAQTTDLGFRIYVNTAPQIGTFTSTTKDANPAPGAIVNWGPLLASADTPPGTAVTFQAAASASVTGPFTFVGPDATPATSFTSGSSLAQFNGLRYLRYQATLSTTVAGATPSLHDVAICFDDVPATTALSVDPATGMYGTAVDLTALLTSGGPGVSGKTIDFSLNGIPVGSAVTDASGVAHLFGASLAGINVGFYPAGVTASFAGDAGYGPSAGFGPLMVMQAPATVILGSLTAVYDGLPHAATATTVPRGLFVTFTYDGSPTPPTNAGSYTVVGTIVDPNYFGSASGMLTIDKATAGVIISGLGPYIYDALPKGATVTTTPPGLVVTVTYDGGAALPVSIGGHTVVATVVDANYAGTATATLVIGPPIAATMVSPTPGSTLTGPSATFTWTGFGGATQYWLSVGTTLGGTNLFDASTGTSLSRTVIHLPVDGSTIFVRLFTNVGGVWLFNDYTYVATTTAKAAMLTPAPGSTLTGPSASFTWSAGTGAIAYWLTVGTTAGGNQIYDATQGTALGQTVLGLPVNGSTVYVRLWTNLIGAGWQFTDYTYTAASASLATMTSPTPGSTLGSSATFTWSTGSGVGPYWLWVGTTLGGTQIYDAGQGMATSRTVSGIPHSGGTIFVRLWSQVPGSGWQFIDYTYAATVDLVGNITTPTPGSTLSGSTITFTWDPGSGGLEFWLYVGTTAGGQQIYNAPQGLGTSATVNMIPTNGSTLFVRLWTRMPGSGWQFRDYTYTTGP